MTNRKLRKILEQNQINVPEKIHEKRKISIRIPRRVITRTAQVTACLALVCALGLGYVAMLRFVGRPGGTPSNDGPGSQLDIESTADTTKYPGEDIGEDTGRDPGADTGADVVTEEHPVDITAPPTSDNEPVKLYAAAMAQSGSEIRWWEFDPAGDVENDAISQRLFKRMTAVEGSSFDLTSVYFTDEAQYRDWVKSSALSGSDGAIITGKATFMVNLARLGLLENMSDMPNSDLLKGDDGDWPENMVSDLSVNDNLYFASGVISPNTVANTYVVFANGDIDKLLGVDIYQIVEQGKWTFDKMYELTAQGGASLNGAADHGLVLTEQTLRALGTSAGVHIANNSATVHTSLSDGTALDFVNDLAELLTSGKLKMTTSASSEHISTLFQINTIGSAATLGMEKYQILPMPALTEGGKHLSPVSDNAIYYGVATGTHGKTLVVINNMANAMQVVIGAGTSYSGSFSLTPAQYFGHRYAMNDDSIMSLEIAIDNMTFSLDSFLTTSVTDSTLKNALNAADAARRQEILEQPYFNSAIMAWFGILRD